MITALWNLKKWFRFSVGSIDFPPPPPRSRPSRLSIITRAAAFPRMPSALDLRGHWNTNKVSTNGFFSFSQRIEVIGHQSFVSVQPSEPVALQVLSISHPRGVLASQTLRLAPLGRGPRSQTASHSHSDPM